MKAFCMDYPIEVQCQTESLDLQTFLEGGIEDKQNVIQANGEIISEDQGFFSSERYNITS